MDVKDIEIEEKHEISQLIQWRGHEGKNLTHWKRKERTMQWIIMRRRIKRATRQKLKKALDSEAQVW